MNILKQLPLQLLFIMSLSSCDNTGTSETEFNQPDNRLAHRAESGERLRTIMQNINLTIHDSTNVDTQTDKITQYDMEDMIEAVEELLFHAEMMSTDLPVADLGQSDITTFRALSGQLYTEALNIQQTTRNYNLDTYDFELLGVNYRRLYQTCVACHQLFRGGDVSDK